MSVNLEHSSPLKSSKSLEGWSGMAKRLASSLTPIRAKQRKSQRIRLKNIRSRSLSEIHSNPLSCTSDECNTEDELDRAIQMYESPDMKIRGSKEEICGLGRGEEDILDQNLLSQENPIVLQSPGMKVQESSKEFTSPSNFRTTDDEDDFARWDYDRSEDNSTDDCFRTLTRVLPCFYWRSNKPKQFE